MSDGCTSQFHLQCFLGHEMFSIFICACYHVPADEEKVTDEETGLRVIPMAITSKQTTHERYISFHYNVKETEPA